MVCDGVFSSTSSSWNRVRGVRGGGNITLNECLTQNSAYNGMHWSGRNFARTVYDV